MKTTTLVIKGLGAALAAVSLTALATAVQAQAEVKFTDPAQFSDAGETERDREDTMKRLEEHLKAQVAKQLPGKQLKITFSDVDLAGEIEPKGAGMYRLRVLRSVTIPRLEFSYELSENGQALKSGTAQLKDLNYQLSFNRYGSDETMRYEKKLLDDWIAKELVGGGKVAQSVR